jgi:methyl-accepting chemotaxis protein
MALAFNSVRSKLVALVALVAFVVGVASAIYDVWGSQVLLRSELAKRGTYIAANLAYNAKYGVLTEDKPLLTQFLDGALASGDSQGSDVVAAVIRDGKGEVLVQKGAELKNLPQAPAARVEERDAYTVAGEAVVLFRAPVTGAGGSSGDMAAELGVSGGDAKGASEVQKGGVEVAISKSVMRAQLLRRLGVTSLLVIGLVAVGAFGGWYLVGLWFRPLDHMVEVSSAVAKGDLTESLKIESDDEIGTLAKALQEMVSNLRRIVDQIQDSSVQVASSAGEISANARLITQGAQGQAQAAEETSTSMEEMAASIQTVAANSQSLANYVEETSSSITQMGASIEQVARSSGTLATNVTEASATIEEMTVSIDQMAKSVESLAETVTETSATVEEMTTIITSVAKNAESLSVAAHRTSVTVSEMAGAVTDVAKLAEEADRISQRASQDAKTGDEAVGRTVDGMKSISETMENTARVITGLGKRSQEIGKILEVIEEIADQTNLLALNAAIEAARAGEAGRGFAVVADEVRKLAERSVEAAKEIGEVVRQVQADTGDAVDAAKAGALQTKEGIALADRAGLALRSIIESVSRSSQLMGQIASATSKQSQASAEVLQTVSHMNNATTQVTTAVREQAEGSKQIRSAMENIKKVMTQAAYSTKEQAAGGRQVRGAVEDMNRIASQVGIATKEQAEGSRQIIHAVEKMNGMTQQVSHATAEQKRGGELVLKAMENISDIARDNLSTVEEMSKATSNLAQQAENLAKLVAVFRLQ